MVALVVLLLVSGAVSATADSTSPTRFKWAGCLGNSRFEPECARIPGKPVSDAWAMAISPNDRQLYVADNDTGALAAFHRSRTGSLRFSDCFANLGDHGCEAPTLNSLGGLNAMAMSPDGHTIYVTSEDTGAVTFFHRAANGTLSFEGCLANRGAAGCAAPDVNVLRDPAAVVVSPDGRSVYVATEDHALAEFDRAPDGALSYRGCFADRGRHGCKAPMQNSLVFATSIAMSPDGKSLYVGSYDDQITIFDRHSDGSLTSAGCITDEHAPPKCGHYINPDTLVFNEHVEVTPDGKSVLVSADKTFASFRRSRDGSLKLSQCFAGGGDRDREPGCEQVGHISFGFTGGVAVSDDGRTVDVPAGGRKSSVIVEFKRSRRGHLALAGCIATGSPTSPCSHTRHSDWKEMGLVALSHDGKSLYAGGYPGIATFRRHTSGSTRPERDANSPSSISFWDPSHAVLGTGRLYRSHGGTIKVSNDGGSTFHTKLSTDAGVGWVDTAGSSDAWAQVGRGGTLLHSSDGGRTWDSLPKSPGAHPSFATPTFGVESGRARPGLVYATYDGGESWQRVANPCHDGEALAVSATTSQDILEACGGYEGVGGQPKAIFSTADGGAHWQILAQVGWVTDDPWDGQAPRGGLDPVSYISGLITSPEGLGLMLDDDYAMSTTNGGRHWDYVDIPTRDYVESGQMFSADDWVVLEGSHLLSTGDGGATWSVVHRFG